MSSFHSSWLPSGKSPEVAETVAQTPDTGQREQERPQNCPQDLKKSFIILTSPPTHVPPAALGTPPTAVSFTHENHI